MAKILGIFEKQPDEISDYNFSFVAWLAHKQDTLVSFTVDVDSGIVVESSTNVNGLIKVFISGGLAGESYKITCTVFTPSRVKQAEIIVRVVEI